MGKGYKEYVYDQNRIIEIVDAVLYRYARKNKGKTRTAGVRSVKLLVLLPYKDIIEGCVARVELSCEEVKNALMIIANSSREKWELGGTFTFNDEEDILTFGLD